MPKGEVLPPPQAAQRERSNPPKERKNLVDRLFRFGEGRILHEISKIKDAINEVEPTFAELTDDELRAKTGEFKERLADGETLNDVLVEAYATVREASKRVLGERPYDVQVMAAIAMHSRDKDKKGSAVDMKTGEGKTLASVMTVYLNALAGKGAHVVTVNDYLAQRDAEEMGKVYKFLDMSVGVIVPNTPASEHKAAYACDVTYGSGKEFGFDYLRDNADAKTSEDRVQRGHYFALVDEIDSVLIDEARTPLILSKAVDKEDAKANENIRWHKKFAQLVDQLPDELYEVDNQKRTVALTDEGITFVEEQLKIDNLYDEDHLYLTGFLTNALKAKHLYKRDTEYVVLDDEVVSVDEFTGRILPGRRYKEGLHQALEAKEGVPIQFESETTAMITYQNYFRMYEQLSGMSGTAADADSELNKVYGVNVVSITPHRPVIRIDADDVIYQSEKAKFEAVVEDIVERHARGQPVLVGTVSVENSEKLAELLRDEGIDPQVLNAKYHAREAEIIAQAGRKRRVTVATNMAGRGTDILLGGNPEGLAKMALRERGISEEDDPMLYGIELAAETEKQKKITDSEYDEVVALGGLYVLGTERHESRRIDDQLRGRSGRQGDPGESGFYLSLDDPIMKRFADLQRIQTLARRLDLPANFPIEGGLISAAMTSAQHQIEQMNADTRKEVLKYDDVLNTQREIVYAQRQEILDGDDKELRTMVDTMIEKVIGKYVAEATTAVYPEDWDLDSLWEKIGEVHPVGISIEEISEQAESSHRGNSGKKLQVLLQKNLTDDIQRAYTSRTRELQEAAGPAFDINEYERLVMLAVKDSLWSDHLLAMDALQDGVGLRVYGQRDPLVEYRKEGLALFTTMQQEFDERTLAYLFNLPVVKDKS